MARQPAKAHGFTIIELLVVVSIIALLIGLLLPAIGKARDTAKTTQSISNLRNLAAANATYEVDYNRHVTYCKDDLALYGGTVVQWEAATGLDHPRIISGYSNGNIVTINNTEFVRPYLVAGSIFGTFRYTNVYAINQYINGLQYDPTFFAPKDTQVYEKAEERWDDPDSFQQADQTGAGSPILWCSYAYSPAAMYSPDVWRNPNEGGFQNPNSSLPGAFRCPNSDQARYPDLKTHIMEFNWLQGKRVECNPFINGSAWQGTLDCEPVWAHHTFLSTPMTLFYDGHVRGLGAREAYDASQRHNDQVGYHLWHTESPWGADGYFGNAYYGLNPANSMNSFHFLTTDGILGRDTLGEG